MIAPRLKSERLLLREWVSSDEEPFMALNRDPHVMELFPNLLTPEESAQFITRSKNLLAEKKFGLWAVETQDSKEFIGFIGLNEPTWDAHFTPCIEIGWRLAKKFWGRGFATEGARRVLEYAFDDLKLQEVVSFTSPLNQRSIKVMEKIGMKRNRTEDFDHPKVEKGHRLERHVLYRLKQAPR